MTQIDDDRRRILLDLLKQNREKHHIIFEGLYSNHMSHGLIALFKLGAPAQKLQEFFIEESHKLEPRIPSQSKINADNWKDFIGHRIYYSDYVEFFMAQIEQFGVDETLEHYTPPLFGGVSGPAFHGLIMLGFALEFMEDIANIAEGLAFLCFSFNCLGLPSPTPQLKDPFEILKMVKEDHAFDEIIKEMKYKDTMQKMKEEKYQSTLLKYDILLDRSLPIDTLVQFFVQTAAQIFLMDGARDFFLLHGITASRALKKILSHVKNLNLKISALEFLWRSLVAVYVGQGRPELQEVTQYTAKDATWDEIVGRIIYSVCEVHLIKLVFVCHEEARETQEEESGDKFQLFKETAWTAMKGYFKSNKNWVY